MLWLVWWPLWIHCFCLVLWLLVFILKLWLCVWWLQISSFKKGMKSFRWIIFFGISRLWLLVLMGKLWEVLRRSVDKHLLCLNRHLMMIRSQSIEKILKQILKAKYRVACLVFLRIYLLSQAVNISWFSLLFSYFSIFKLNSAYFWDQEAVTNQFRNVYLFVDRIFPLK